jgi:MSHA biogenesis protein MshO
MAQDVTNNLNKTEELPFRVINASLTRNGLVNVLLMFKREEEMVNFSNEVHIPNVP